MTKPEIEHRNPRDRERESESGRREAYLAAGVGGGEDDLASATASAVPELMTSSLIPLSPSLLFFLKRRRKIKKKVAPFVPRGRFYSEKRDVRQRGALAIWTVKTDAQSPPSYAFGEQRSDRSRPIHPDAAWTPPRVDERWWLHPIGKSTSIGRTRTPGLQDRRKHYGPLDQ